MAEKLTAERTLADLGDTTPEKVIARFAELRHQFDKEIADCSDRASWESFLVRWTGRKAGTLLLITTNWLEASFTGHEASGRPGVKSSKDIY